MCKDLCETYVYLCLYVVKLRQVEFKNIRYL
jgi:hypothetical protein